MAVPLVLLALGVLVHEVTRQVTRARVERFARRQRLVITPDNGGRVMTYLGTTRRWRTAGLVVGALTGLLWSLPEGTLTLSFTALFAGWFAGAVIAEWRIASLPTDGRRSALLRPRLLSDYLGPVTRALPVLSAGVCGMLALAAVVGALRHDQGQVDSALGWVGAAAAGLALVCVVQRHVLMRSQPPAAADILAADDAIRARSLRVLAGSAVAAAGFPAASLVDVVSTVYPGLNADRGRELALLLVCVAALIGWRLAVMPSRVDRTVPALVWARPGGVDNR